jgi:hypothetical protein
MIASRLMKFKSAKSLGQVIAGRAKLDVLQAKQLSSLKSWVPQSGEKLEQITISSLIHEVAEQQRDLTNKVRSFVSRLSTLISNSSMCLGRSLVPQEDACKCYLIVFNM